MEGKKGEREKECVVCCVTEEGEKRKKEGGRKWRSDGFDEERMEGRGWNGRSLLPFPTMIRASNGGSFFPFLSFYFPGGLVSQGEGKGGRKIFLFIGFFAPPEPEMTHACREGGGGDVRRNLLNFPSHPLAAKTNRRSRCLTRNMSV